VTLPRFLVSPTALAGTSTVLTGEELHHLRVRRLRVGGQLVLSDGSGHERAGTIAALNRDGAVIRLLEEPTATAIPAIELALAQAVLKGERLDLVVEKATELGVAELLLFISERTVVRPRADRRTRWERLARSAAKQSQRPTVPIVTGPLSFHDVLRRTEPLRILFWEGPAAGAIETLHAQQPHAPRMLAVVGPEGGFSSSEVAAALDAGFHTVGLGRRILRAETAAIVAATLCQFLWGDTSRRTS
jgi:16S rRNA (uracil1498-N3)-methyltransferase